MILIITEKNSVTRDFATALGASWDKIQKYYYNEKYIITNSIGHLLSLDPVKMGFNKVHKSLVIPTNDIYKVNSKTKSQLNLLKDVMNSKEVTEIIAATDADRAGEMIFWNIYNYAKCKKPVKRFWTSKTLEKELILELLNEPEDHTKYYPYAEAERLRMYSDLVLGYNCSTAYALKKSKWGLSLGRVQTPVLMEIIRRYIQNKNHVAEKSYSIELKLKHKGKEITLKSVDSFKDEITNISLNGKITLSNTKLSDGLKKRSPELYNKSSLIVEASSTYKIDAKDTSKILQDLYQNHKVTSYPRTDSRYLDEKPNTVKAYFNSINELGYKGDYSEFSKNKVTIFNNSKVKGHYALVILNAKKANTLMTGTSAQTKILKMIKKRMIIRASNPIGYDQIDLKFSVPLIIDGKELNLEFTSQGRRVTDDGWLIYDEPKRSTYSYQESLFDFDSSLLSNIKPNILESISKAPPLYNSGSIVKWMEDNNLGTPATIESYTSLLKIRKYIKEVSKTLVPTELGLNIYNDINNKLIGIPKNASFMDGVMNDVINSGNSQGFIDNKSKMDEVIKLIFDDVSSIESSKIEEKSEKVDYKCYCGSTEVKSEYTHVKCNTCKRSVPKTILGVKLKPEQSQLLICGGYVKLFGLISKKSKKRFNAKVTIKSDGKINFEFI
jgi:DNA topoisomerase-3